MCSYSPAPHAEGIILRCTGELTILFLLMHSIEQIGVNLGHYYWQMLKVSTNWVKAARYSYITVCLKSKAGVIVVNL